jgi:hypothetical protein
VLLLENGGFPGHSVVLPSNYDGRQFSEEAGRLAEQQNPESNNLDAFALAFQPKSIANERLLMLYLTLIRCKKVTIVA